MYLGLDLGTASVKAALFDADGRLARTVARAYDVRAPMPNQAESDPQAWWIAVGQAVRTLLDDDAKSVHALGLSGQMHGVVLCDAEGEALRPAILWADARSTAELRAYDAVPDVRRTELRNPITTGMAGPTLLWLRQHEASLYGRARFALQPKDWLRLRLTGEAFAEPSDASGTLLYDLERDTWHAALVEALGLRLDLLAPLVPSSATAGFLSSRAAKYLGLPSGLPVAAGAADTAAALLGTGITAGQLQLTIGTGAQVVRAEASLPASRPALHVFRSSNHEGWYTLAAVQNAGLALEWARRTLHLDWTEFYEAAQQSEPGARGLTFLPYMTGDRTPHLDPQARGGWIGAGLEHDASHLARSAFEGVALSIRDAVRLLTSSTPGTLRLAGGGSLHPWWRQLLADILQSVLEIVDVPVASAYGAALLAQAAETGRGPRTSIVSVRSIIEPRADAHMQALADATERFSAAYTALRPWFSRR
ncbi:xylulokinase [Deinococcus yavapaiensis]|uniref:Xylulose kinase n=1 Tax=Deinococcus yavapaiensis KR-236 TaxID=694435 RepID=A0A318S063_9DEIO|nr:xylulokinase [Deinococcus yavapaiensis]PYE48338.1 xylulokinase [Deinococcus yavapaiensis KR-236]